MTVGQVIEIGPLTFTVVRLFIFVGAIRVIIKSERISNGLNKNDMLVIIWGLIALLSSFFHEYPSETFIYRMGLVYNAIGIYFLVRIFCHTSEDALMICRVISIILIPVAIEMFYETKTLYNLFSLLGRVTEHPVIRNARIRAQGPFAGSILAGTVGAVSLPLSILLWKKHRRSSICGTFACLMMIYASGSSGPIMTGLTSIGSMLLWYLRKRIRLIQYFIIAIYLALEILMKQPAYFIMAKIDLTGGSTGWHRARLIQSSMQHLSEWWLAGTDHTRHWMPTGISWSVDHTDITNHYIKMGVLGGLPLMMIFIFTLISVFAGVGRVIRHDHKLMDSEKYILWGYSSSLFAHAVTFASVSYYDQTFVFFYLTLAVTVSIIDNYNCSDQIV